MQQSFQERPSVVRVISQMGVSFIMFLLIIVLTIMVLLSLTPESEAFTNLYVLGGLILFIVLLAISPVRQIIIAYNTTYIITPEKIESAYSFITKSTVTIPTSQITDVQSRVGFLWDKLFKVGTLEFYTSGSSGADISLKHISNVNEIYLFITNHSRAKEEKNINSTQKGETHESEKINLEVKPNVKIALMSYIFNLLAVLFFLSIFIGPFLIVTLLSLILGTAESAFGLLVAVAVVLLSVIAIGGSIYMKYKYYSNIVYRFYDTKIEYFDGFLTVQKHTVSYQRITNSSYTQSFIDRILGVSTLIIETAGSSSNLTIRYINHGEEINSKIQAILQTKGVN